MNKKLLSVAIAGALAASVAAPVAQADVTIYGRMHMSLDYFDADTPDGMDGISDFQVASNSSRIGFKGSEDLGSGLKAIWQVETGFNVDEYSSNSWSSRNSFLGLSSSFGTLIAGKHDTPMKIVGRKLDPFGDTIGDTRAILGQAAAGVRSIGPNGAEFGTGANNFNLRTPNTVAYISPNFMGITFIGAYVADYTDNSKVNSNNDNQAYSASLTYSNGGLYLAGAYEYHYSDAGNAPEPSGYRVGGSYKFQSLGLKIGGLYEDFDGDASKARFRQALKDGNAGMAAAQANGLGVDRNAWTVFATWDFLGNNTLKAAYTGAGDAEYDDDSSAYMASVGIDHKFSKRTKLYLVGSYLNNKDDNSAYILASGGHGSDTFKNADPSRSQKAISLGMIHNF